MPDLYAERVQAVYDELASYLRNMKVAAGEKYWIGLAGSPGSGKSTLAAALKERLGSLLTVIPMDGYHFYRMELDQMADPAYAHVRRGAPFTFNASKFVSDLKDAHLAGEGIFPGFDHGVGDPVAGEICMDKQATFVLVEGNYLLINQEPWTELYNDVFDETWFIQVSLEESNERVFNRHLGNGLTVQQAKSRVESNDSLNAALILAESPSRAQRIIEF